MSATELLERTGTKKSVDTNAASDLLDARQVGVAEARAEREAKEARERAEVQEKLESFPELVERMDREIAESEERLLDFLKQEKALQARIQSNEDRMAGMKAALAKLGKNEIDSQVVEEHTAEQTSLAEDVLKMQSNRGVEQARYKALKEELKAAKGFQAAIDRSGQ